MHRPDERPRALRLVDGRCPARHAAYRKRERPVFVTLDDCSGSIAPVRQLNQRTFDRLFVLAGVSISCRSFGDFLVALATSSYVLDPSFPT
jgi:hypothetical protein